MKKVLLALVLLMTACTKTDTSTTTVLPAPGISAAKGCVFCEVRFVANDPWTGMPDTMFATDTNFCYMPDSVFNAYIKQNNRTGASPPNSYITGQGLYITNCLPE